MFHTHQHGQDAWVDRHVDNVHVGQIENFPVDNVHVPQFLTVHVHVHAHSLSCSCSCSCSCSPPGGHIIIQRH